MTRTELREAQQLIEELDSVINTAKEVKVKIETPFLLGLWTGKELEDEIKALATEAEQMLKLKVAGVLGTREMQLREAIRARGIDLDAPDKDDLGSVTQG